MSINKKLEEYFVTLLNKGVEAAELISEQDKKAMAYAELAKALGTSGLLSQGFVTMDAINTDQTVEPGQEGAASPKESIKKGAGKKKANKAAEQKTEEPVKETEEEAPVEVIEPTTEEAVEETAEEEDDAEWTDRMSEKYAQCLEDLNFYVDSWGEDYVYGDCVRAFFETDTVGAEAVRPTNIEAFLIYLYSIYEESQNQ